MNIVGRLQTVNGSEEERKTDKIEKAKAREETSRRHSKCIHPMVPHFWSKGNM